MAKVWPVYEGRIANQLEEPWAILPLTDAVRVLDLIPEYLLTDLSRIPKFGDTGRESTIAGYRHVVIEVGENEAKAGWKPGYYRSPLSPNHAYFRLQVRKCLGSRWRDEWKKGQDADGEPAVWLWAVLKADAPDSEWERNNRERIQSEVRKAADDSGFSDWVFVRFRKEKEETAVS